MTPFCPLYPWLDACTLSLAPIDPPFNVTDLAVDCRDIGNRLAILQILATHGHRHPWALGGIWSALTDEQAGRVVAEIVRRIGPDITRPADLHPVTVLGPWTRESTAGQYPGVTPNERAMLFPTHKAGYALYRELDLRTAKRHGGWRMGTLTGQESDEAGRGAADTAARHSGALLWEDMT